MAKGETYEEFVEKFKPKKTTDDCYTPPEIYEAVKRWACKEYGIDQDSIVRPFWPGGDYEHFDYPEGCVVLDNPPFSILTKICEFYLERGIDFFLFAPSLTCFSGRKTIMRMNHVICNCDITYQNGAVVRTSFVTSFRGGGDTVIQTSTELTKIINEAGRKNKKKELPKYSYPKEIVTAAMLQRFVAHGFDFELSEKDCVPIYTMDAQRKQKKAIYGGGLLLSQDKAEECRRIREQIYGDKEKTWELSDREREITKKLGREKDEDT